MGSSDITDPRTGQVTQSLPGKPHQRNPRQDKAPFVFLLLSLYVIMRYRRTIITTTITTSVTVPPLPLPPPHPYPLYHHDYTHHSCPLPSPAPLPSPPASTITITIITVISPTTSTSARRPKLSRWVEGCAKSEVSDSPPHIPITYTLC